MGGRGKGRRDEGRTGGGKRGRGTDRRANAGFLYALQRGHSHVYLVGFCFWEHDERDRAEREKEGEKTWRKRWMGVEGTSEIVVDAYEG